MGIYQSTPDGFVEPIAYGFEQDAIKQGKTRTLIVVPASIRKGACYRCLRRTKSRLQIEDRALDRHNAAIVSRARSQRFLEAAGIEIKLSHEMLEWAGRKHAESTETKDKAPRHLRRQLKDGYTRYRTAILKESHCLARVTRKEKAFHSTLLLYEKAKTRSIEAMNKQVECAQRCSRKINTVILLS